MKRTTSALFAALILLLGASSLACGDDMGGGACCKTCKDSKPCGDSCIPKSSTCNKGPGCAC